jgi:hypothetical protein
MLVWPITYLHVEKGMTVYIVQEMRGRDLSDAVTFGDIEVLIPASEQASITHLKQTLMNRKGLLWILRM